jgi:hypothetical protein
MKIARNRPMWFKGSGERERAALDKETASGSISVAMEHANMKA